jgi:ketosteroid isomerase-like protein
MKSMVGSFWKGILFFVTSCSLFAILNDHVLASVDTITAACAAPAYHEFDFWMGDWEVSDIGNPAKVAHARIDSILEGCVLREDYQGTDGHQGQSFTIYDAARSVWHQTWVTSGGTLLELEGRFANGEMMLSGRNQKGEMVRGIWKPVDGEVREIATKSADGGKTWEPWFDIIFRRADESHTETPGTRADPDRDKETVAALDTEYQEAVKQNDATTMDRILSDDFVLVTSSGKTYTKSDLLVEAKSGYMAYEHQEDTDKTVRLWGDIAVVTAKLWEKGTEDGKPFEYKLWFSDIYRHTPSGWRYVFAQSAYSSCGAVP